MRLLRQTCEGFGVVRGLALGLEGGRFGSLGMRPCAWAGPEVGEHHAQPEQDQNHQLIVEQVWYHGMTP